MGASWRIGVPGEPTKLVTSGPYKYIRNPIYTGFLAAESGLVLLLPSVASAVVLAVSIITILEWTRVEELQQLEMHGAEYKQYRAATGRFLPRLRRANSE